MSLLHIWNLHTFVCFFYLLATCHVVSSLLLARDNTTYPYSLSCQSTSNLPTFLFVGKIYEKVCEMCHITVNKIAIFGENGVITPGGVRIGECRSHSIKIAVPYPL